MTRREPVTKSGKQAVDAVREVVVGGVRDRFESGFDLAWAVADLIAQAEDEAIAAERQRIREGVHVSRSTMPIWAHVDAYGLGRVLKGEPWPEDGW